MLTGATLPAALATSLSTSSSASLSTLKQPMPTSSARRISTRVLPTPEKMMSRPAPPAASTRSSSPPDTMSKPQPACGEHLQHRQGRVGFHGIADAGPAAGEAALVGGQRRQHGRLGVDEQRRAVLARQSRPAGPPRRTARRPGTRIGDGRARRIRSRSWGGRRVGRARAHAGGRGGRRGRERLRQGGARRGDIASGQVEWSPETAAGQGADHARGKDKPAAWRAD